ncbi:MAG: tetratricopeptide repeat protein [Flavobacteriales bacterium]|nr:tetratricopeptide repeat protein [Flavobacteriales bacterium]
MSRKNTAATSQEMIAPSLVRRWLGPVAIVVLAMAVYAGSLDNGFVNWDDTEYILTNSDLHDASLRKHFVEKTEVMGNYHPLTMWSLALSHKQAWNERMKTLDASVFHTTDLVLHMLSALLAYVLFMRHGARSWVCFITTALFAVHPVHVESVAWASERKDVLHGFFYLAALVCYTGHVRSKHPWWWVSTLLLFVAALLSKATAVSLVPVLFLIDWYSHRPFNWRVLVEKLPLIALAIWAGLKAIDAQHAFESVQDLDMYPLWQRALFACYGLWMYVLKFFVPFGLSAFFGYPPAGEAPDLLYWVAMCAVVLMAALVVRFRKHRELVFGTGFFLITVALVLQLLPVGGAVLAERYTYIPYLGLAFAVMSVCWKVSEERKAARNALLVLSTAFVLVMAAIAHERTKVWKDGVALWEDAIAKDDGAPKSMNNYGVALTNAGRHQEALEVFDRALMLKFDYGDAFYNRGLAHFNLGQYEAAIADYTSAIRYRPELAEAWHNRAGTYYTLGRPALALPDALKAKDLGYPVDPKFIEVLQQQTSATQTGAP